MRSINSKPIKRTRMSLLDFGTWLLAALRLKGVSVLDDYNEERLHAAFRAAFEVIEREIGKENLLFTIILDPIHRLSYGVSSIFWHWRGIWGTKDSPGTTWRLHYMSTETAQDMLEHEAMGGKEPWLKAADAFLRKLGY